MSKTLSKKLLAFDQSFYDRVAFFDEKKYLYPANFDQEKARFFAARTKRQPYNPVFSYASLGQREFELIDYLQGLEVPKHALGQFYTHIKQRILLCFEMIENRQPQSFSNIAQKRYGVASSELVQDAQIILQKYRREPIDDAYFGIKAVSQQIQEKLVSLQISHWRIEETQSYIWLCQANTTDHKLLLPSGLLINQAWIDKILDTIVEVSLYRNQNARAQPLRIFELGLDRFEETGLGLMIEIAHRRNSMDSQTMRHHAGGVLASYLGHQFSFWETYLRLSNVFSQETAFTLTAQTKMGLEKTAEKGGILNTHLALQGWKKVQLMTQRQLTLLYLGHVGMDHLEMLEQTSKDELIDMPSWLPDILRAR